LGGGAGPAGTWCYKTYVYNNAEEDDTLCHRTGRMSNKRQKAEASEQNTNKPPDENVDGDGGGEGGSGGGGGNGGDSGGGGGGGGGGEGGGGGDGDGDGGGGGGGGDPLRAAATVTVHNSLNLFEGGTGGVPPLQPSPATSYDAVSLERRGFKMRVDGSCPG
jgi:hypothetical protein